jgi:hypothetical protein
MDELHKRYAYIFLALRALIDLALCIVIYRQTGSLATAVAVGLVCSVFYLLLYFGVRDEQFYGRYGRWVILWREPGGYWLVVGFLIASHLAITALVTWSILL